MALSAIYEVPIWTPVRFKNNRRFTKDTGETLQNKTKKKSTGSSGWISPQEVVDVREWY